MKEREREREIMMAGSLNRLRHFFNLVRPRGIEVDFM